MLQTSYYENSVLLVRFVAQLMVVPPVLSSLSCTGLPLLKMGAALTV